MGRMDRLPFMLGVLAAIITGAVSYAAHEEMNTVYLRMVVMMLVFFVLGMYIRWTICKIKKELEIKKEKEKEEAKNLEEKQRADNTVQTIKNEASAQQEKQQVNQPHKLDLTAGGQDDDFEPLAMSKAVRTKMNENK